jgi:hypothetical protein
MIARPTPSRIGGGVRSSMNVASSRMSVGGRATVKEPTRNTFAHYRKEKMK